MDYLVIKCGGSVFERLPDSFYENIVSLHKEGTVQPVIVHGGGPLISSLLQKLGIPTTFVNGLRVTTNEMLDVIEMVLSGSVNKKVVAHLRQAGGVGFGLSGIDGGLIQAEPVENFSEIGFVGKVVSVNDSIIRNIAKQGMIPVISPIGSDTNGQRLNINGDSVASAIAKALKASFCLISDIPGIYEEKNGEKSVLHEVTEKQIEALIKAEQITGGMIPKVEAALMSLSEQHSEAVILNGLEENSLIKLCKGERIGTKIVKQEESVHA